MEHRRLLKNGYRCSPAPQSDRDPNPLQIKDEEIEYAEYTVAPLSPLALKGEPVEATDDAHGC